MAVLVDFLVCVHVKDQFFPEHPIFDDRVHLVINPDPFLFLIWFILSACRCLTEYGGCCLMSNVAKYIPSGCSYLDSDMRLHQIAIDEYCYFDLTRANGMNST